MSQSIHFIMKTSLAPLPNDQRWNAGLMKGVSYLKQALPDTFSFHHNHILFFLTIEISLYIKNS